jgi:hypothetical protein
MPIEPLHRRRLAKNIVTLALLVATIVLFFALTMIKMKENTPAAKAAAAKEQGQKQENLLVE